MDYRIVRRGTCAVVLAVAAAACGSNGSPTEPGGSGGPPAATVTSITIGGDISLSMGSTSQLSATANKSDGTTENVTSRATWQSTNTAVATVSGTGLVSALTTGTADVTAVFSGQTARRTLQVAAARFRLDVTAQSVTALSTCDDFTQGLTRGEFAVRVLGIPPSGSSTLFRETTGYPGNPNDLRVFELADGASANLNETRAFTLDGAQGQSLRIQFNATEWDTQIVVIPPSIRWIPDSRLNNASITRTHSYSNGTFSSLGPNTLTLGNSSCGLRLNYSISATRQ